MFIMLVFGIFIGAMFLVESFYVLHVFFEQPYIELANSYGTGKITELQTYVQTNKEKFESVSSLKSADYFISLLISYVISLTCERIICGCNLVL